MLERVFIKKRIASVLFAIFCISLFSCSDSHEPAGTSLVTLRVTFPDYEDFEVTPPLSRAGDPVLGEGDENKITSLKFFIFSGGTLELYKEIAIDGSGNSSDPMWDSASKALRITVTQGLKDIYCLANWTDNGPGMPAINDVTVTSISDLTGKIRTHTNLTLTNPPVMTGSLQQNIQGNESGIELSLRRQIARVELSFKLSNLLANIGRADIKITGVKFLKLAGSSYVFPQSTVASPSGMTWGQTSVSGVTSAQLTGTAVAYGTRYYIPEYAPSSANDATVMVIRADYNGMTTYYSITLNPADNVTHSHPAYVIERNHTYRYTLTIEGMGSDIAPTRSLASESTNITYELEIK